MVTSLQDKVLLGREPRRGLMESSKRVNGVEWSRQVELLHAEVTSDADHKLMVSDHFEKLSKSDARSIAQFMVLNRRDKNFKNPTVSMSGRGVPLNGLVAKTKLKAGYRVAALVGEHGLFARRTIPKDTVLGRYEGC